MTGGIYSIPIQGDSRCAPHFHVVVIELQNECWVVPAFGADGLEVDLRIRDFERMGYPRDLAAVQLDNAEHVAFFTGHSGLLAYWFIARSRKLSKRELANYPQIGEMDSAGLLRIMEAFLQLADAKPDWQSPHLTKKVRKIVASMKEAEDSE